ncbi:MAG: hypothetical protein HYX75_01090 [Acidobacteria bacterium]|nr:hypothetical protein [Acidobacteriota bacterium]
MIRRLLLPLVLTVASSFTLSAATTVSLNPGDWLTVKPGSGVLSVLTNSATVIKVECIDEAGEWAVEDDGPVVNQTVILNPGQRVIAKPIGGVLTLKSSAASLIKIFCDNKPKGGKWKGTTSRNQPMSFNVTSNSTKWNNFTLKTDFKVGGCTGTTTISVTGTGSISGNKFSYSGGNFGFTGEFTSTTAATGTYRFTNLYLGPFCPSLTQSGTWTASANASGAEESPDELGDSTGRRRHREVIIIERSCE